MLRECPFQNMASLVSIKGSDLRAALEQALRKLPERAGNYPQVAGLRIRVDLARERGQRIVDIHVEDKTSGEWRPLDESREYACALTEFIRNGGDGLSGFTKSTLIQQRAKLLSVVVREYLKAHKEIAPVKEGRTVVLYPNVFLVRGIEGGAFPAKTDKEISNFHSHHFRIRIPPALLRARQQRE